MPFLNKVAGYISGCGGDYHPFCLLCSCKNTFVFSLCATKANISKSSVICHFIFPPCATLENTEQIETNKNELWRCNVHTFHLASTMSHRPHTHIRNLRPSFPSTEVTGRRFSFVLGCLWSYQQETGLVKLLSKHCSSHKRNWSWEPKWWHS